jgi:hypothetical protein
MGSSHHPPTQEGYRRLGLTVPDVKPEDFRDLKVSLRFGFESGGAGGGGAAGDGGSGKKSKKKKAPVFVEWTTPYALCYPEGTRARGCQELITPLDAMNAAATANSGGGAVGLPCTAPGGTCPFVSFTCSKGHAWKAEPGTPACFYCPRCREKTRHVRGFTASGLDNTLPLPKLRGRRRVLDPAARFREAVAGRGGKVLGSYLGAKEKTRLRCDGGHEWEATPENVMRGSWCPACARAARAAKRALTLADMQVLAEEAGGRGARCLGEEYRGTAAPLLWACAGASGTVHFFKRSPNYVRKGLGVGRAFCVECEKLRAPKPRPATPSPSSSSSAAGGAVGKSKTTPDKKKQQQPPRPPSSRRGRPRARKGQDQQ